jgi:hypothetical protein
MARKSSLRAVKADEKLEPKRPRTILEAAEHGSRIEELRAMRRRLARALDDPNTAARDLAALSRRQLEIGKEIEAIVVSEDEDHSVVTPLEVEAWDGTGY